MGRAACSSLLTASGRGGEFTQPFLLILVVFVWWHKSRFEKLERCDRPSAAHFGSRTKVNQRENHLRIDNDTIRQRRPRTRICCRPARRGQKGDASAFFPAVNTGDGNVGTNKIYLARSPFRSITRIIVRRSSFWLAGFEIYPIQQVIG